MQRVRVGLTGLAFVFLLVMLGTAFLRMAGDGGGTQNAVAAAEANGIETTPSEPLAQLGVVPGNVPPEQAPTPAKPVPAVPTRSR